jgi:hypothetical protein
MECVGHRQRASTLCLALGATMSGYSADTMMAKLDLDSFGQPMSAVGRCMALSYPVEVR